jgi:hypothetical protein
MQGVRWNDDEGHFEGRCDACALWWPIEPETRHEFWPVRGRGLRICRACDRLKTNARISVQRATDATKRDRDRGYNAAYYASLSPTERRALRRTNPDVVESQRRWAREGIARSRARS